MCYEHYVRRFKTIAQAATRPSAIADLRAQCTPEEVPKKPKSVTDQQLLKIVDEIRSEQKLFRDESKYAQDEYDRTKRDLWERIGDLEDSKRTIHGLMIVLFVALAMCLSVMAFR